MSKETIDKSNYDVSKEFYSFPSDEAAKLENHILGEGMHMDYLDYDKIRRQVKESEALKNNPGEVK